MRADEPAALLAVAGVLEERERLALAGAVALAALALVGEGGGVGQDVADVVGEIGEERLEHGLLLGRGRAGGDHVAALPVARAAALDAVEEGGVDPLEVEHGLDRLPHALVLPGLAAQVEEDAAGEGDGAGGDLGRDDVAALLRREVVAGQPAVGVGLAAEGVLAGLEGLEGAGLVGVVVDADLVEVVGADVHGQVLGPVVRVAAVDDGAAGVGAGDLVGAGAERRVHGGAGEVAPLVVGLGEDRGAGDGRQQVADRRRPGGR